MKKLYIVYECDTHRSYDFYVIKLITPSIRLANKLFNAGKRHYDINTDYYLNIGCYTPVLIPECDNNILRNLKLIKTTESND